MPYFSKFYQIEVRDEIAREFINSLWEVDDMLAGLHEIRARMAKEDPWLKKLHRDLEDQDQELKRGKRVPGKKPV